MHILSMVLQNMQHRVETEEMCFFFAIDMLTDSVLLDNYIKSLNTNDYSYSKL